MMILRTGRITFGDDEKSSSVEPIIFLCWGFQFLCSLHAEMYDNLGTQPGMPRAPTNGANLPPNPFGNSFYGAGSGLIRGGLGAYGEKILGSSSEYVQSNVSGTPTP